MDFFVAQRANNFHAFFPENIELQFYQVFRKLKNLGCDYFYFLGTDKVSSYRFCTHEHWIDAYHSEKFILHDPLKRIAEDTDFIILPWEQITHLHGKEKVTMCGRISFGLFNGLTIVREYNSKKYIFAFATESKEHDLARFLLLEHMETLQTFALECMKKFNEYSLLIQSYEQKLVYM